MIKDVMVWLDGGLADEIRLTAVSDIAQRFDSHVTALVFNPIPPPIPGEQEGAPLAAAQRLQEARTAGDKLEASLAKRLRMLERPAEIRRFDVLANDIASIAAREARAADTFVALRPNGSMDPDRLIEGVLFGSGRHLYLYPETERPPVSFDRIVVAWNGSREAARALAEAMPFLHLAKEVVILVVTDEPPAEEETVLGSEAVSHLQHHGIDAILHRTTNDNGNVAGKLMDEVERRRAGLIVMGGYGHARLREWLLGGVTYDLMHAAAVPVLMAH
jgi:nucleotide-binding universal stress UspA family protein